MSYLIPASVHKALPPEGLSFYQEVFMNSYQRSHDDLLAHQVAWAATRKRLREVDGQLIANAIDFAPYQLFSFDTEAADEVIIKNTDSGELELDILLANTNPRKTDGKWFSEEDLNALAEQINTDGSTLPDVDHSTLNKLQARFGNDLNAITANIKREKGVFKSIKAIVRDGKLWVKAFLDKRYKNYVDSFSKVSIEAIGKVDPSTKRIVNPRYLGFTFTHTPNLAGVGIAS